MAHTKRSTVRVIAGLLKGRRLEAPQWAGLRPTSDGLRETLFNILFDRPAGARVLDACAGTGAFGIEALSRGAHHVVFVDDDRRATDLVTRNLEHCGVAAQSAVVCGALPGIATADRVKRPYDLVLVDPPYDHPEIGVILSSVAGLLEPTGVLVLERARRVVVPMVEALEVTRTVKAGDSALDFYRPANA